MSVNSKMAAIAEPIRTLKGTSSAMGLDAMASNLTEVVNACDTQADLIAQIKTALADKAAGGVELPTLENPGSASDLAQGKQLIGADGSVVEGNLNETDRVYFADDPFAVTYRNGYFDLESIPDPGRFIANNPVVTGFVNGEIFGDAKPEDVRAGVYFTSKNGLKIPGTALLPGGGSVYPEGAFAPVTSFTDGKQYALVSVIGGVRRYINTTDYNQYTMNATEITIAEDAGDYVIFSATPALFTAVASGDGFLLQNGSNYLHGTSSGGSTALRVGTTQMVWTVDTSATGGFSEGKYNAKEDANAVWLFNTSGGYDWSIKYETGGGFGYDREGRDNTWSTGFTPFVLYEYVAGEGEVNPVVDTSDASVSPNQMLAGASGYAKGRLVEGNIQSRQAQTITPRTTAQEIPAGVYLAGKQTIQGDSNLTAGNIRSGVSIFGVAGSYTGSGSTGATVASKTTAPTANSTSISFTGLTARPKMFSIAPKENISFSTSNRFVVNVMYDGTTTHGMYVVGSGSFNASYTGTYSAAYFTWTYSNGTLTVTTSSATNGGYFASGVDYQLTYAV